MSMYLLAAGVLSAGIGIAHSVLGEQLVLVPLFQRGDLPKLLGSEVFARRTLRFAWHLTTVLLIGISILIIMLALAPPGPQAVSIVHVFAITFGACSLASLVGARGKHFSWWVFLLIALLLWIGA